jgi:hypothetical protein
MKRALSIVDDIALGSLIFICAIIALIEALNVITEKLP